MSKNMSKKKKVRKQTLRAYWQRQLAVYVHAWRRVWDWRTLGHVGIDVALGFLGMLLFGVYAMFATMVARPFAPVLSAIAQLEASNPTDPQRLALLEGLRPNLNLVVFKVVLIAIACLLVFLVLYVAAKSLLWNNLQQRRWEWRIARRRLIVTALLFLAPFVLVIPLLLIQNPYPVAIAFLSLLGLVCVVLPLCYAMQKFPKAPWWHYLAGLALLQLFLFTLLALITLVSSLLAPVGNALLALLTLIVLAGLLALLLLSFQSSTLWPLLRDLFSILLAMAITWLIGIGLISLTSIVSQGLYAFLTLAWLVVFLAWGRYLFDSLGGGSHA